MNKLRWRKEKPETGLRAIGRDPNKRPTNLTDGTTEYGTVYHHDYHVMNRGKTGCFWTVSADNVPYRNTCNEKPLTEAEAKAACMAHVKAHLP